MQDGDFVLLRRCRLFSAAPAGELRRQLERLPYGLADYDEGRTIRTQGDSYQELLVLLRGSVAGEFRTHDGRLMRVETLVAPDALASAFLFAPQQRLPVDVIALKPARLFRLSRKGVMELAGSIPEVLEGLLGDIAARTGFLASKLRMVQFETLRERLAHYLLDQMSFQKSSTLMLPVTKRELADIVGGARQSLFRCLGELEDAGIIHQKGKSIHVIMPEGLRELASSGE